MNIYICGNPLVKHDSMPFKILEGLRKSIPENNFIEFDPTENFPKDNPLYIIDTALGILNVTVVEDVERLEDAPNLSAHDADLAFHLKWLKKMGKLPVFKIFCVPPSGDKNEILKELLNKLEAIN